jgi:hypothetical protein
MKKPGIPLTAAVIAAGLLARCATPTQVAGGTTDTGNPRVTGVALVPSEQSAVNLLVRMRSDCYVAPIPGNELHKAARQVADVYTDESGKFVIDSVDTGFYTVEISGLDGFVAAVRCTVAGTEKEADLGAQELHPPAVVTGSVPVVPGQMLYAQIYGLERIAPIDSATGTFVFTDIPEGTYTFRIAASDSTLPAVEIDRVPAVSGESGTIGFFASWKHSCRVALNTSSSGAAIDEDILGFPVLIRLNSSNFDFSQAQSLGQDIRFARPDDTQLPYELEYWNGGMMEAAVWVKVDTVKGNDSVQYIVMYWGNPLAPDVSNGAEVFDTGQGYMGVWHLAEAPEGDSIIAISDQTFFYNNAWTAGGMSTANQADGIAGKCLSFDGVDDFVHTDYPSNAVPGLEDVTMSAWINTPGHSANQSLVAIEGAQRYRMIVNYLGEIWFGIMVDSLTWIDRTFPAAVTDGAWHHLATVFDRDAMATLYIDGAAVDSFDISSVADSAVDSLIHFAIGHDHYNEPSFFKGKIDEARVMKTGCSAAWVRLCYENQKEGSTFVKPE